MQKSIRFVRYVIVGGMTTFLDIFVLYFAVEFLHLSLIPASTLAFFCALLFSFFLNKSWTFQKGEQFDPNEFLKFFFVSTIGLFLTLFCMSVLTKFLGIFYLFAKILTSCIVLAWNFLGNSIWVFTDRKENEEKLLKILAPQRKRFPFEVSIVIPAYNEEDRLPTTLEAAKLFFENEKISYEIIVVDDGSSDQTSQKARKILKGISGKVTKLKKNRGKGYAVKVGMHHAQGKYILFCDADGATPFPEYKNLRKQMNHYHIAIGSRYLEKGKIQKKQPAHRTFFSRIVNFFAQIFLIEGISDTQCGFKLFRSNVGKKLFSLQKIERFAFDVEVLVLGKKWGYKIAEVPVEWHDQEGSKFSSVRDGLKTAKDFILIKFFATFGMY